MLILRIQYLVDFLEFWEVKIPILQMRRFREVK